MTDQASYMAFEVANEAKKASNMMNWAEEQSLPIRITAT